MHLRTFVTNMRNLAKVRSLGWRTWVEKQISDRSSLQSRNSQRPDLPQLLSPGLLGGLKYCMRFPAKQLISQLPTASFFFCSWGNRKPDHLALGYTCLTLPSGSCNGHSVFISYKLPTTTSLNSTSFSKLPVPAEPPPLPNHEFRINCWQPHVNAILHNQWPITYGETPEGIRVNFSMVSPSWLRESRLIGFSTKGKQLIMVNPCPKKPLTANPTVHFQGQSKAPGYVASALTQTHTCTHPPPPSLWITERQAGLLSPFEHSLITVPKCWVRPGLQLGEPVTFPIFFCLGHIWANSSPLKYLSEPHLCFCSAEGVFTPLTRWKHVLWGVDKAVFQENWGGSNLVPELSTCAAEAHLHVWW